MNIAEINKDECLLIGHLKHKNAFIFELKNPIKGEEEKEYNYLIAFYKNLKNPKKELIRTVLNAKTLTGIASAVMPKGQCAVRQNEEDKKNRTKKERGVYRGDDVENKAWEKVKRKYGTSKSYNGAPIAESTGAVFVPKTKLQDYMDSVLGTVPTGGDESGDAAGVPGEERKDEMRSGRTANRDTTSVDGDGKPSSTEGGEALEASGPDAGDAWWANVRAWFDERRERYSVPFDANTTVQERLRLSVDELGDLFESASDVYGVWQWFDDVRAWFLSYISDDLRRGGCLEEIQKAYDMVDRTSEAAAKGANMDAKTSAEYAAAMTVCVGLGELYYCLSAVLESGDSSLDDDSAGTSYVTTDVESAGESRTDGMGVDDETWWESVGSWFDAQRERFDGAIAGVNEGSSASDGVNIALNELQYLFENCVPDIYEVWEWFSAVHEWFRSNISDDFQWTASLEEIQREHDMVSNARDTAESVASESWMASAECSAAMTVCNVLQALSSWGGAVLGGDESALDDQSAGTSYVTTDVEPGGEPEEDSMAIGTAEWWDSVRAWFDRERVHFDEEIESAGEGSTGSDVLEFVVAELRFLFDGCAPKVYEFWGWFSEVRDWVWANTSDDLQWTGSLDGLLKGKTMVEAARKDAIAETGSSPMGSANYSAAMALWTALRRLSSWLDIVEKCGGSSSVESCRARIWDNVAKEIDSWEEQQRKMGVRTAGHGPGVPGIFPSVMDYLTRFNDELVDTGVPWRFVSEFGRWVRETTEALNADGNVALTIDQVERARKFLHGICNEGEGRVRSEAERSAYDKVARIVLSAVSMVIRLIRERQNYKEVVAFMEATEPVWVNGNGWYDTGAYFNIILKRARYWDNEWNWRVRPRMTISGLVEDLAELSEKLLATKIDWRYVSRFGEWVSKTKNDCAANGDDGVTSEQVSAERESLEVTLNVDSTLTDDRDERSILKTVGGVILSGLDNLSARLRKREKWADFVTKFDAYLGALTPARDSNDWFAYDRMEQLDSLVGYLESTKVTWWFIPVLKEWVHDNWETTWDGYFRLEVDAIRKPLDRVLYALGGSEISLKRKVEDDKGDAPELSAHKHVRGVVEGTLDELRTFVKKNKMWEVADGWDTFVEKFDAWLAKQPAPTTIQDRVRRLGYLSDYLERGGVEWPFMKLLSNWVSDVNDDGDGAELKRNAAETRIKDILRSCDDGWRSAYWPNILDAYNHVCEFVKNELDAILEYVIANVDEEDDDDQYWSAPEDDDEDDDEQEWGTGDSDDEDDDEWEWDAPDDDDEDDD